MVAGWWKREEMERKRGNLAVLARRTGQRPVWAERLAVCALERPGAKELRVGKAGSGTR